MEQLILVNTYKAVNINNLTVLTAEEMGHLLKDGVEQVAL